MKCNAIMRLTGIIKTGRYVPAGFNISLHSSMDLRGLEPRTDRL